MRHRNNAVRRAMLVALMLTAAAPSCAPVSDDRDYAGNVYPPACRGDLSHIPVSFIPSANIAALMRFWNAAPTPLNGGTPHGITLHHVDGTATAYVDEALRGWKRDDIVRHERCHVLVGGWHR